MFGIITLPLSTHQCPQMGFYTICVTPEGRDQLTRDSPHSRSSLSGPVLLSGLLIFLSGFCSLDFQAPTFPERCFTIERSQCFPWAIIFNQTSNQPTKPLTSQLVGLTLTLLHIRTTEKRGFRAQIWDLHPAALQRACGFKGLQSTGFAAALPKTPPWGCLLVQI